MNIKTYTDPEGIELNLSLIEVEYEDGITEDGVMLSIVQGWDFSPPVYIPRIELLALLEAI